MYELIRKRFNSMENFREYLEFMIENVKYAGSMPDREQDDFWYHYNMIPEDTMEFMKKRDHGILSAMAQVHISMDRLGKAVKDGM
jgi:hypothetical protein